MPHQSIPRSTQEQIAASSDASDFAVSTSGAASPASNGALVAKLSPAMLRELLSIERTGEVSDLAEFGVSALAFYARDKVIGALEKRGLIEANPDWSLTDAGRAALALHAKARA